MAPIGTGGLSAKENPLYFRMATQLGSEAAITNLVPIEVIDFAFQDTLKTIPGHDDPEIETIEKSYQLLPRTLGKGTFAKVYVAVHRKTKVQLAVKIMDRIRYGTPEHSGGTDIEKEVVILQSANHPNITPVVDVRKTTRYIYIFMQMLTGGDLFEYVMHKGTLPELEAKFVIYQILQALQIDLKPENLLLTSATKYSRVLLSDFGMARELDNEGLMSTMCGTFAYMAPEVFDAKYTKGLGYGHSADCWSLGITLYVIISGTHPFTANYALDDEKTMCYKMKHSNLLFPARHWKDIGPEAKTLITHLLDVDPQKRWSVDDALQSEWIQNDLAWLQQEYRGNVLPHWHKSLQHLSIVQQDEASSRTKKRLRTEQTWRVLTAAFCVRHLARTSPRQPTDPTVAAVSNISFVTGSMEHVPDIS
ncbi:Serine/threonine-protein kinase D1 [Lobosporangium transversale]|nr:Serine/threonine-protein kinase D1 [Lobosporangium transversale]